MAKPKIASELVDECLSYCPEIPATARYWFVRTEGGMLFDAFLTSNCIAYGLDKISLATVRGMPFTNDNRKILSVQISKEYPEIQKPGLAAAQIFTFVHKMSAGDFVIIPSYGSRELAIGVLQNKPPFESDLSLNGVNYAGHNKKRAVRWLRRVDRSSVNPNLFRILFSHVAISDVSSCDRWIDTLVYDFFKKGNVFHYALGVTRATNINAKDLFGACSELFELGDEMASEWGITGKSNEIDTRINLNSPGVVELMAGIPYVLLLGCIIVALVGGKFSTKDGTGINLQSEGFIEKINKFLNDRKRRQLADVLRAKLESLQVKDSDDIIKILEKINRK